MPVRQTKVDSDLEGPLALNDNAFELCRDFLGPDGGRFFKQVSRYDDYLADVLKKAGYKTGDTLKLIAPFLKASGLTNSKILDYSSRTMLLVSGAKEAFCFLRKLGPVAVVSTSYRLFVEAVGKELGLSRQQIYCTELDLDRYGLVLHEQRKLLSLVSTIANLPEIELSEGATFIFDLPDHIREATQLLDIIFWEIIPKMEIGVILRGVDPVGGVAKVSALNKSAERTGIALAETVYVGDSITDVQAFEVVKKAGGLAVAFNGNRYALAEAEVAIAANNVWPTALVVAVFAKWGKEAVLEMIRINSQPRDLRHLMLPCQQEDDLSRALQQCKFRLFVVSENREAAEIACAYWRKEIRGATIAALG